MRAENLYFSFIPTTLNAYKSCRNNKLFPFIRSSSKNAFQKSSKAKEKDRSTLWSDLIAF